MESPTERKVSEALANMSVAEKLLIEAIAEQGNEKVQNAFLKYQNSKTDFWTAQLDNSWVGLIKPLERGQEKI